MEVKNEEEFIYYFRATGARIKNKEFSMFKRIMYNCEKAQRLSIKKQESKLTLNEYLQLKIHMRYCDVCLKFQRFSLLVNHVLNHERRRIEDQPPAKLSPEEKEELQRKIDELSPK